MTAYEIHALDQSLLNIVKERLSVRALDSNLTNFPITHLTTPDYKAVKLYNEFNNT